MVLAWASRAENRGEPSSAMWLEEGASSSVVAPDEEAAAAKLLAEADVIWMGGGDQDRLLDELERLGLVDDLLAAHARGALIGGTSAGAAVLGSVCIAGDPEPEAYVVGGMRGRAGLGLLSHTIIDQHFRERKREGRLLTAVLDAGRAVGYGVSESTALFFEEGAVTVMGSGVVVVFDARQATVEGGSEDAGALRSGSGIRTSILSPMRDAGRER
ncbi:cyanophycinase [Saltatorellus ferox]|uniref:cyanophycinase n=1 Tax=Saltatorellus ferox TaxID=2528018 RepID=UPI003AF337E4